MFLSIVIAVYNEEENVNELTERVYSSVNSLKVPFELIYVVDGDDHTLEILSDLKKSRDNLIIDHSPKLRGFKNAFATGFNLVSKNTTHILTMDGDLNHQPEEIENLIKAMNSTGSDIAIGSRYASKGKVEKLALWKMALSVFANNMLKLIWGIKVRDKTSGFRLYKRKVIDSVLPSCTSDNFEFLFEILILSQKLGYNTIEVPIVFKARERGESKFQFWKALKGYVKLMLKYCW